MRSFLVLSLLLTAASTARAGALGVPPLQWAPEVMVGTGSEDATVAARTYVVPQRYAFALDETRAFWFAAGSSAAISLGAHVLIGVPAVVVGAVAITALSTANPVVTLPLLCAVAGGYLLLHGVGTGLAAWAVFNGTSNVYEASLVSSIAGHLAGDLLAAAVVGAMAGASAMLLGGLAGVAVFTGGAGFDVVILLTALGSLPALVVAGVALVVVPALVGAWAMAITATPAAGYAWAPDWRRRVQDGPRAGATLQSSGQAGFSPRDAVAVPLAQLALTP